MRLKTRRSGEEKYCLCDQMVSMIAAGNGWCNSDYDSAWAERYIPVSHVIVVGGLGMGRQSQMWMGMMKFKVDGYWLRERNVDGYTFQTGGVTGMCMWREWMNVSLHMRLKQMEAERTKIVSVTKCSVWQKVYQHKSCLSLEGIWMGTLLQMWMVIMEFTMDMAVQREMLMVNN